MKFWILSICVVYTFIFSLNCLGSSPLRHKCRDRAYQTLKDDAEKFIFNRHSFTHQFIDCESPTFGIEVVIHEAAHLEDLGVPAGLNQDQLERWFSNPQNIKFNQYLTSGLRNGEMQLARAPKPKDLILQFLKKNYPHILSDENHMLQSFLEIYIHDTSALASYSFSKGIITELNGYVHGLRIERRLKRDSADLEQRYGVLGFLFFIKAYLAELKNEYPRVWKQIKSQTNRDHFSRALEDAAQVLQTSNHCNTLSEIERRDLFNILSEPRFLAPLQELLARNPRLLGKIICR